MQHECGLDVTYCDECSDELEEGQVGLCSACKTYTFEELSESAKQRAREDHTSGDYPGYDWWDGVYEDANRIAKILGLDIESTHVLKGGGTVLDIDISFSGFCSQGDGASFRGSYTFNPKAVKEINTYCNNVELIRIASELTVMQTTQRLKGLDYFTASVTRSGNYDHSGCMSVEIHNWGIDEIGEVDENQFAKLMRDFADWIYKTLEAENDHLMSDEVVDGYLEQEKFDEDGVMV